MSWGALRQQVTLDWAAAWREIAEMTAGEQPPEIVWRVLQLDNLYKANDRAQFVEAKTELKGVLDATGETHQAKDCGRHQHDTGLLRAGDSQQPLFQGVAGRDGERERAYPRD